MIEKTYATPLGEIHYWVKRKAMEAGHEPVLVFLPGLTADHRLFDKQVEVLSQKYSCLVWDAPAHGKSRPFKLEFTLSDMAHYLRSIFVAEQIVRPVLVGQSLGGYVAQVFMELFPNVVAGFVSIDSCPLKRSFYTKMELVLLKHTKSIYMSIPWRILVSWGAYGTSASEYGRSLMRTMMSSYVKPEFCSLADHGYRILAYAVEEYQGYDISCPVLLVCGEKDGAGSARRYNRIWSKCDGHKLVWISGAGHNSNTDAPAVVNHLIEEFVSAFAGTT